MSSDPLPTETATRIIFDETRRAPGTTPLWDNDEGKEEQDLNEDPDDILLSSSPRPPLVPIHQQQQHQHPAAVPSASNSSAGGGEEASHTNVSFSHLDQPVDSLFSRHSDYTVPTSNTAGRSASPPLRVIMANQDPLQVEQSSQQHSSAAPSPQKLLLQQQLLPTKTQQAMSSNGLNGNSLLEQPPPSNSNKLNVAFTLDDTASTSSSRRNIFGSAVEEKYQTTTDFSELYPTTTTAPPPNDRSRRMSATRQAAFAQQQLLQQQAPRPQQRLSVAESLLSSASPDVTTSIDSYNSLKQKRPTLDKHMQGSSNLDMLFAGSQADAPKPDGEEPSLNPLSVFSAGSASAKQSVGPDSGLFVVEAMRPPRPTLATANVDGVSELTLDFQPSTRQIVQPRPVRSNSDDKGDMDGDNDVMEEEEEEKEEKEDGSSNYKHRNLQQQPLLEAAQDVHSRHKKSKKNRSVVVSTGKMHRVSSLSVPSTAPAASPPPPVSPSRKKKKTISPHETIHAQSLLLGLAFCAVWSPSNVMAPNLTEMADYFQFDNAERDLYLGSYCALATGVLSFPIGAGIGILADMVNRKYLFCGTLVGGALSAMCTGRAESYWQLLLARLVNGGFMAGSVPVAFSLLGDLFAVEERNAASSGLTAMMGLGIILGQVYAGTSAPTLGWQHAFGVSAAVTLVFAIICLALVQEPERGGKERVLQDMIKAGTRYERKLSWKGFWHACLQNASNSILLWQGFFSSLPWGVIFVFLNDYLSQERGLSVPAATYLVFLFGLGCAVGGVLGGYWGQLAQGMNRRYLPLFMAVTTELGILPFLGLLNVKIPQARGTLGILFAFGSGLIASLPSVNVRPCLINVNPPETRGAALTAANLLIQLGRGIGPSCVTLLGSLTDVSRQQSLNVTLTVFWTISALQLVWLSKTLPQDQDRMEAELAKYAASAIAAQGKDAERADDGKDDDNEDGGVGASATAFLTRDEPTVIHDDPTVPPLPKSTTNTYTPTSYQSISVLPPPRYRMTSTTSMAPADESVEVSIEERMTYFDGMAVNQTLVYVRQGIQEFKQELEGAMACTCGDIAESSSEDNDEDEEIGFGDVDDEDNINETKDDSDNEPKPPKTKRVTRTSQTEQPDGSIPPSSLLYSGLPPPIESVSTASEDGRTTPATTTQRSPSQQQRVAPVTEETPLLV